MGAKNLAEAGGLDGAPLSRELNPIQRILVVDDEPGVRQLAAQALIQSGYAVDAAADAAAAWEELGTDCDYDLLITDNTRPKLTGIELLKKLRAARMILPVIMATRTLPEQEFFPSPWLQPAATLIKPYDLGLLLETVKKVLSAADSAAHGFQWRDLTNQKISQTGEPAGPTRLCPPNFPRRILVVDEDRDVRLLYIDALARPGYFIDVAEDGAAAWDALQANHYSLLITGNNLPRLTGVELVKKMRAAHMILPVVMTAGRLPAHELARYLLLQPAVALLKPFTADKLLATVSQILNAIGNIPAPPLAAGLR